MLYLEHHFPCSTFKHNILKLYSRRNEISYCSGIFFPHITDFYSGKFMGLLCGCNYLTQSRLVSLGKIKLVANIGFYKCMMDEKIGQAGKTFFLPFIDKQNMPKYCAIVQELCTVNVAELDKKNNQTTLFFFYITINLNFFAFYTIKICCIFLAHKRFFPGNQINWFYICEPNYLS